MTHTTDAESALHTLKSLGWTREPGAECWKPPLGQKPAWLTNEQQRENEAYKRAAVWADIQSVLDMDADAKKKAIADEIHLTLSRRDAEIAIEALQKADHHSLRLIWLPVAAQITTAIELKIAEDLRAANAQPPPNESE